MSSDRVQRRRLFHNQVSRTGPIATRASNMKNSHFIAYDCKQSAVGALAAPKDELTDFGVDQTVFLGKLATFGKVRQRAEFHFKTRQPACGRLRRPLGCPQISVAQVLLGGLCDNNPIVHTWLFKRNSARRSENASANDSVRPAAASASPRLMPSTVSSRSDLSKRKASITNCCSDA
jgi:hypothetical protein